MAKRPDVMRQFDENAECFSSYTLKLQGLVGEILANTKLQVHSITGRTKDRASLLRKLSGGSGKYDDLSKVTDICGVRVITYFESDVDKVASAIEAEFDIDSDNSVDKRALFDPDRFGYLSLHYVVSLTKRRADLLEYRRFRGLKAEIQVRSILQHAWAEIEHDLGYKTALGVPRDIRREFSRLAGLLELADREFSGIRNRLAAYERQVISSIKKHPEKVLIDKASLKAFVGHDPTVPALDRRLGEALGVPVRDSGAELLDWYAAELQVVGLTTIGQLRDDLTTNADAIIRYGKAWTADAPSWHGPIRSLGSAVCMMYLILIRAIESGDQAVAEKVVSDVRVGKESISEALVVVTRNVAIARGAEPRDDGPPPAV